MQKTMAKNVHACIALLITLGIFFSGVTASAQPASSVNWTSKWIRVGYDEIGISSAGQYFRKEFDCRHRVKKAILYCTARGMYEIRVNGQRVGEDYLAPGWTSYQYRLQYQAYDVTNLLNKGNNAIGLILGNGWYRGQLAWGKDNNAHYGSTLAALVQLEITNSDGKKEIVTTDDSWKSAEGAIRYAEIYHGETIDSRKEKTGWDKPGYSARDWSAAKIADFDYANLIPMENEPVRKHEVFVPVKILTTPKGETVIDFGQNMVGWVIVKVAGKAGDTICIDHGEVLAKDGNFYRDNIRGARAQANYILSGKGVETFEPHFTFYGFRYIRITGYSGEIKPGDFTAVALYSNLTPTGSFECSNPLLNQLQHNIQWGQRGNFLDIPTDCPQRDERLGWTGDAQAFFLTAAFNFNVNRFFSKWTKDMAAEQGADGNIPFVVPDVIGMAKGAGGSAGWSDVATIIPWHQFEIYRDTLTLARQYPMMKKWVDFIKNRSSNDLWQKGFHFGDWLSYRPDDDDGTEAVTDKFQIAQCFWAYSTQNLINAARVLGKTDDIHYYESLLARIKAAFVKEYVTGSGRLMSNTQTAYVLALQFDMLPEDQRARAVDYLVDNIRRYNNHLTTGFLGTPYLCHVLSRFGQTDVAYMLLLQETYPSWLYPVKMGATTIWERWDGIRPDGSFQTTRMNSFNHYAYGAIGDWMYRNIAGIQPLEPGYKKILIRPLPGGGLTWAKGSYKCSYGKIVSEWKINEGKLSLYVEIPPGTTAEVHVPSADGKTFKVQRIGSGKFEYEG